jgi:hypothetical protein
MKNPMPYTRSTRIENINATFNFLESLSCDMVYPPYLPALLLILVQLNKTEDNKKFILRQLAHLGFTKSATFCPSSREEFDFIRSINMTDAGTE